MVCVIGLSGFDLPYDLAYAGESVARGETIPARPTSTIRLHVQVLPVSILRSSVLFRPGTLVLPMLWTFVPG